MFPPHFGVAFRSIAHGATVGLVTTLISCSLGEIHYKSYRALRAHR